MFGVISKSLYLVFIALTYYVLLISVVMSSVGDLGFDVLLWLADFMAHGTIFCLDLHFLFLAMVLCKRYRLVNKLLVHVGKPWKTFRDEKPPNYVLQNILQYRFDQVLVALILYVLNDVIRNVNTFNQLCKYLISYSSQEQMNFQDVNQFQSVKWIC